MNIIDEITDRLNDFEDAHQYDVTLMSISDIKLLRHARDDIALLLGEVKRLEGEVSEEDGVRAAWRRRTQEAEALALSLAEALSDAVPVLEHAGRTHFDAVWRLIKAQAALSSPALLKLKGVV